MEKLIIENKVEEKRPRGRSPTRRVEQAKQLLRENNVFKTELSGKNHRITF